MSNNCGKCKAKISISSLKILCTKCQFYYHATCASLTEVDIDCVREQNLNWTCHICKSNTRMLRSTSDSAENKQPDNEIVPDLQRSLSGNVFVDVSSQEGLSEFQIILNKLTHITTELAEIKSSQAKIVTELTVCSSKLAKHERLLQNQCGEIKECKNSIKSLQRGHNDLETDIESLKTKVNQVQAVTSASSNYSGSGNSGLDDTFTEMLERISRSKNLLIGEIAADVDVKEAVSEILSTLSVDGSSYEILSVVRFSSKAADRPGLVRVTFSDPSVVVKFLRNKAKLLGTPYERCYLLSDKTAKQRAHLKDLHLELSRLHAEGDSRAKIRYIRGIPKIVSGGMIGNGTLNSQSPAGRN